MFEAAKTEFEMTEKGLDHSTSSGLRRIRTESSVAQSSGASGGDHENCLWTLHDRISDRRTAKRFTNKNPEATHGSDVRKFAAGYPAKPVRSWHDARPRKQSPAGILGSRSDLILRMRCCTCSASPSTQSRGRLSRGFRRNLLTAKSQGCHYCSRRSKKRFDHARKVGLHVIKHWATSGSDSSVHRTPRLEFPCVLDMAFRKHRHNRCDMPSGVSSV